MNPDTTKQLIDALRPIADKLGQGAGQLYQIYVRQAYNDAITDFIWAGVLGVILIGLGIIAKKFGKDMGEMWVLWAFGMVIPLFFFMFSLTDGVQHLVNPGYFAIHNLICDARGSSCQ